MQSSLDPNLFRAALFDVDGTLVDSLPMILAGLGDSIEAFEGSRPTNADLMATMGTPLASQLPLFSRAPLSGSELEQRIATTISRYQHHVHLERWFEPAIDALRAFKRAGCPVALVTSRNDVELHWFLERFPARDCIDTAVCASDVSRPKPAPDPALLACERLGVSPDRAVLIGDSIHDARCARSAGCTFVAVTYGAASPHEMADEKPNAWFDTPEALRSWTEGLLTEHHATH